MKTYSQITWNTESLEIISRVVRCENYSGFVDLACGASSQEKMAFANEQKISQMLTSTFAEFSGTNKEVLNDMIKSLSPISEAGPSQFGLAPAAEAAERTSAAENLSAAGTNAANAVRSALASRGGGTTYLPSGSEASIIGSLAQDTAVKEAEAQAQITQHGYDLGRENWLDATRMLAAAPGELESPVTSAGGAAIGGAQLQQQGAEAITQANNAWIGPVAGILGAAASGATMGATGGAKKGCWIAEAIYGVDDVRTHLVRAWLNNVWSKTAIGSVVMSLYLRFGQTVAHFVKRSNVLKMLLTRMPHV
jgi:hypothetical protein